MTTQSTTSIWTRFCKLQCSALAFMLLFVVGCNQRTEPAKSPTVKPTSFATRALRRAFDGAPPVVAHESFGISCVNCHTKDGKEVPTVGMAPANPHWGDPRDGSFTNCKQCHVFATTDKLFAANTFEGLKQVSTTAERAFPGAPPVIPHSLSMRNNCNACHAGASSRPEIRCSHPERTNCVQCHVADRNIADPVPQLGNE